MSTTTGWISNSFSQECNPPTHPVILNTSPPQELPPRSADDSWTTVSDDAGLTDDAPLESPGQPSVIPVTPVEPDQLVSDPIPVNTQPQASLKESYKPVQEKFLQLYTECDYCQLPSGECPAGL